MKHEESGGNGYAVPPDPAQRLRDTHRQRHSGTRRAAETISSYCMNSPICPTA